MTTAVTILGMDTKIMEHGMWVQLKKQYLITEWYWKAFCWFFCEEVNIDQSLKDFWHAAACQLTLKLSEAKIFH